MKRSNFIPVTLAALLVFCTGCFRVGTETSILRDSVLKNSSGTQWEKKFELGLGRITMFGLKLGGSLVAESVDVPPEAKAILSSAKGVETSIYHAEKGAELIKPSAILARADKAMEKRGWYRLVTVTEPGSLIAVFVQSSTEWEGDAKISVLVLDDRDLVCVSARSDLRPLLTLALEKAEEKKLFTAAK